MVSLIIGLYFFLNYEIQERGYSYYYDGK
jgi:hypothetical protein